MIPVSFKNVGTPNVPQEIKRLRRQNMDMCRKMGEPVAWLHQFNNDDLDNGYTFFDGVNSVTVPVELCPACYSDIYGQTRNNCPVCFGVSFASVEVDSSQWIDRNGLLQPFDPGTHVNAPLYGGYGPAFLTWIMEPDVSIDVFRINEQGVLVKTQNGQGVAPWYPQMGDNDLIINVQLAPDGETVLNTFERFQLKMTNPATMRGWGRKTIEQEHKIAQTFQMSHSPSNTNLYNVQPDRKRHRLFTDSATVRAKGVPKGVDSYEQTGYSVTGIAVPSGLNSYGGNDVITVTGVAIISFVAANNFVDTNSVIGVVLPSNDDNATFNESAMLSSSGNVSSIDNAALNDARTTTSIAAITSLGSGDSHDAATTTAIASASSVDAANFWDGPIDPSLTLLPSLELDTKSATVVGVAAISAVEVYTP